MLINIHLNICLSILILARALYIERVGAVSEGCIITSTDYRVNCRGNLPTFEI